MPELPEVERATTLLRTVAVGKKIDKVEITEDPIVFSGVSCFEFAKELNGRIVDGVSRYGKVFYLQLGGQGRMPVLHFGMTGMLQVKGVAPSYYRRKPKAESSVWPPKYMKFVLHLTDRDSHEVTEVAFIDARRLARVRLCASPLDEPPIVDLGFDPILSMPSLEYFSGLVSKRTCPIKSLLLDQSFSAGVGNWVADEILYHARVHPQQRCNTLTSSQLTALHQHVNRGKGKGGKKSTLKLPDGQPATVKWLTVGGRTSAYVAELQRLPDLEGHDDNIQNSTHQEESDLSSLTESDAEHKASAAIKKRRPPRLTSPAAAPTARPAKRPRRFSQRPGAAPKTKSGRAKSPR